MNQSDIIFEFCRNINNMRFTKHFPNNKCLVSWDGKERLNFFCDETLKFLGQEEVDNNLTLSQINEYMQNYSVDYKDG